MSNLEKYHGVFPAFYACYDENGKVSVERTKKLARHLVGKGVKGLYVGGSSGECIYLEKEERMLTLEAVMEEVRGECTIIAHVACNNTEESCELAAHAEKLGVDAIASIPPIYFRLPDYAIAQYWNDISAAAPNTDFIIYNIPQLRRLRSVKLFRKAQSARHRRENSSCHAGHPGFRRGRGKLRGLQWPDEQFIAGPRIGASAASAHLRAMPELS